MKQENELFIGDEPIDKGAIDKLEDVLKKGRAIREKVQGNLFLSKQTKEDLIKRISLITLELAIDRYNTKDDDIVALDEDILDYEDQLLKAEEQLKKLENTIYAAIEKAASKLLAELRAETQECLINLEESGAESADNILHDKYLVVKRTGDIIGTKQEGEDPVAILNKVRVEVVEARNYGVNNREPYRSAFASNKQPSGMEILTARRHPVLDKFISVIKLFTRQSQRNHNHNAQPDTNNSFRFFNRTINLPKVKTLDAMPTFSNLEEQPQVQPKVKPKNNLR